jgi:hypothetical protein
MVFAVPCPMWATVVGASARPARLPRVHLGERERDDSEADSDADADFDSDTNSDSDAESDADSDIDADR